MLSKMDSRKRAGEIPGSGKFVSDLETISNALYADKMIPRPPSSVASSRKSDLSEPKTKPKDAKDKKKDSFDKEKKPSIWSWKGLKALTSSRSRRFNCCFSLLVHSIEGLPALFDDVCLVVHWERRDSEQMTRPTRVYQGVAEFEEQLTHSCSIYGSRSGSYQSAKYEAKHFLLYASVYNAPELDLGKHRIDLTRLLPLTFEELEDEKSSGKWTTSFRLSGKARGAIMNVSFGYVAMGNNSIEPSSNNTVLEILSLRQNSAKTENSLDQFDHMDELTIRRVGSLPARLSTLNQSAEDIKDLHEVLPKGPKPTSELCESVNVLYQKLDEISNASVKNELDADPFPSHVDPHKPNPFAPPDSDEKVSETEWEISEFSVVEKGIEEFTKEQVPPEEDPLKVTQASGQVLETDGNGVVEGPLNKGDAFHPSVEEIVSREDEQLISTSNSEFSLVEKGIKEFTKEQVPPEEDSLKVTQASGAVLETDGNGFVEGPLNKDDPFHLSVEEIVSREDEQLISTSNSEFSLVEKGIEEFTKEQVPPEEDSLKVTQASGEVLETDGNGVVEGPLNKDDPFHPSVEEIVSQKDEQLISTSNSTEQENDMSSKESLMKELETALSHASDLMNEGLIDSQEDENEALHRESSLDINSHFVGRRKGRSLSLDDVADSVASEFLNMLGIEHSPFGLSSESEPDSPRERLLKEFEKDALANGGLLNFDIENDPAEFVSNIPMGSIWDARPNNFHQSSISEGFQEMPKLETGAFRTKTKASRLEDSETEALMRDWGLNEKAFQHSPPSNSGGFGSPVDVAPEDLEQLPPLAEGLGSFVQTKNGGFLRSMNPALFRNAKSGGSLIMQVSGPVVVPAEMGSGVMDILQGLAAMGIEKLSMQANKLMPLEDITGKTIQQIAWEAASSLEGPQRQGLLQHEFEIMQNIPSERMSGKGRSSRTGLGKSGLSLSGTDREYVSLEDLAPLAMDKIEALSVEGLRIQSGMSNKDAPSNISTQYIGELSALEGKTLGVGGSIGLNGTGGLQLMDIEDKCEDVDGLMGLSLKLDEWMKLDSGEIDDGDLLSERTSRILSAHHATSLDLFRGRSKAEKRRGRGRKYGLLGNNFTVALMVQLRDPLRNYDSVGTPMLALIQVERVFVPPRPKIYSTVPLARNDNEEEEKPKAAKTENIIKKPIEEKIHEEQVIPQYKITEVHVAGLKMESGKKKLWGSTNQQQSGSRWLLANGMGKKNKHPLMKSKAVVQNSSPASSPVTTKAQPGDTLWSISSRVLGTGAKWKELAALNPHIRNPNVIFPNETIRLC